DAQSHAESLTSAATSAVTDVSIVTLTTNSDVVTFATSAAHTVNGVIGTGATLSNGDSLTGAAGSDTLRISGNNSSFDLNSLAGFTGFEFVDLTGTSALSSQERSEHNRERRQRDHGHPWNRHRHGDVLDRHKHRQRRPWKRRDSQHRRQAHRRQRHRHAERLGFRHEPETSRIGPGQWLDRI